uniref:Secreted protein n=1 Tax=Kwoniella bestiolae CBS 10118 TaxID=1296100 RepID=A0A1B9FS07_9TREE|nr:hypothetical protein I302_09246 [Kwoniella bestiolae CBS 10118]OCF21567.1 hypothetical protein I302_09246 [Kwoniella bestiolae CBS 10118]
MISKILTVLGLASAAVLVNGAIPSDQAIGTVANFLDNYLYPRNTEVAASVNSTLFAEDVKGTVDVSTDFDGRELATEYLFGLFVNLAKDPMEPSPIGNPLHAAIAQGNTVFVGVKFQFFYGALNQSFPVEIDALFNINDEFQVQEYDLIFRRWAWATDLIVPQLIPHMAKRVQNLTGFSNGTYILQQYLAQSTCNAALEHCTGVNQQYENFDQCMTFLNGLSLGQFYRLGENNLGCRYLHTPMLPFRPNVHCAHVGPSGGDMCVLRNYTEVVKAKHFPQGFVANRTEGHNPLDLDAGVGLNLEIL